VRLRAISLYFRALESVRGWKSDRKPSVMLLVMLAVRRWQHATGKLAQVSRSRSP